MMPPRHCCFQRALCATLLAFLSAVPPAFPQTAGRDPVPDAPSRKKPDARKARKASEQALRAEQAGDWATAFRAYAAAAASAPSNTEWLLRQESARFRLVQQHTDRAEREALAGRPSQARDELRAALELDPGYAVARERLAQLEPSAPQPAAQAPPQLAGITELQAQAGTHDFNFRGDVRGAYEAVARSFGLKVSFDTELKSRTTRFRVTGLNFQTAMSVLGQQTGTFWRPLDAHSIFVADDTPQKRREYAPTAVRTILLSNSTTPEKMTETLRLVREIAGVTHTELDMRSRTLTVRDTPEKIAMTMALIEEIGQAPSEVMLAVDLLEVDRSSARKLGITPPSTARLITISPSDVDQARQARDTATLLRILARLLGGPSSVAGTSGLSSVIPPLIAVGGGHTIFLASLPGTAADFAESLGLVRSGRHMLLRAQDGQQATFFIGERYPITLAQLGAGIVPPPAVTVPGQTPFPRTDYDTGTAPVAIVTGSFNGDRNPDLAIANRDSNTVSLLLGRGDGTFGAKTDFPTGTRPSAVATGDFNGDGKLDLAVANQSDNTVSILLGNGSGSFGPKTDFPVGNGPLGITTGDFNGDGKLDLAVVNQADNTVSILLGNGDGSFRPRTDFATGTSPVAVVAGDFSGDRNLDLAVVNRDSNSVSILLGNGDGTFGPRTDFATGTNPVAVVAGDFNGDRNLDLAVVNRSSNTVSILLGNGDGTFRAKSDFATGTSPSAIVAGDFNVDSRLDIAVTNQGANTVSVLFGLGDGQFTDKLDVPTGRSPSSVASADFNADRRPDLAITNQADNKVSVILNTASSINPIIPSGQLQVPYPASQYEDLGLKVRATPRIHGDGEVTLQLQFEIRSLAGTSFNGIPTISNRTLEQTVRLRENEAALLAGMLQQDEVRAVTGSPGFSQATGIGHLAGRRNTERRDTELLIVVTPWPLRLALRTDRSIYAGRGEPSSGRPERPVVPP